MGQEQQLFFLLCLLQTGFTAFEISLIRMYTFPQISF